MWFGLAVLAIGWSVLMIYIGVRLGINWSIERINVTFPYTAKDDRVRSREWP